MLTSIKFMIFAFLLIQILPELLNDLRVVIFSNFSPTSCLHHLHVESVMRTFFPIAAATSSCPAAGFFGVSCRPCPVGNLCPQNSVAPTNCPAGSFCATPMLSAPSGRCQAGYFCEAGSVSSTGMNCQCDGFSHNSCCKSDLNSKLNAICFHQANVSIIAQWQSALFKRHLYLLARRHRDSNLERMDSALQHPLHVPKAWHLTTMVTCMLWIVLLHSTPFPIDFERSAAAVWSQLCSTCHRNPSAILANLIRLRR